MSATLTGTAVFFSSPDLFSSPASSPEGVADPEAAADPEPALDPEAAADPATVPDPVVLRLARATVPPGTAAGAIPAVAAGPSPPEDRLK